MFKQLSQLSKNLTDELAKGLADELNEGQEQFDKNSDLPVDVQAKLRKFDKYEQKYPLLLNAYKAEKAKIEKLAALQKILCENTPISSLEDFDSLTSFFQNTNLKIDMLNDEVKRLTTEKNEQSVELEALRGQLNDKDNQSDVDVSVEDTHKERIELEDRLKTLHGETDQLRKEVETKNAELAKASAKTEALKKASEESATLRAELKDAKEKIGESKHALQEKEEAYRTATAEIKEINTLLDQKTAEYEKVRSEQKLKQNGDNCNAQGGQSANSKTKNRKRKGKNKNSLPVDVQQNATAISDVKPTGENDLSSEIEQLKEIQHKLNALQQDYDALLNRHQKSKEEIQVLKDAESELEKLRIEKEDTVRQLQEAKDELKFKSEELDSNKEILKSVGNELVTAKDQMKDLQSGDNAKVNELKSELESIRVRHSDSIKLYETRQNELKQKITTLETEKSKVAEEANKLKSALEKSSNEYQKLSSNLKKTEETIARLRKENGSITDELREMPALKKSENALKMSVTQKEKTIVYLEQQIKDYSAKEEQTNKLLRESTAESGRLSAKVDQLTRINEGMKNEVRKSEESMEKFIKNNGTLGEKLEVLNEKYATLKDLKSVSHEQVGTIGRQCDELNIKLKEANKRIGFLEDELNESALVVQEKTKELVGMRRTLAEGHSDVGARLQKVENILTSALDEKERLESEFALQATMFQRTIQDLKKSNENLTLQIQELRLKEKNYEYEVNQLKSSNAKVQKASNEDSGKTRELESALLEVRNSLSNSEKKLRSLEIANESFKELNGDLTRKLDRVSKNYKQMSSQLAAAKELKTSRPSSRSNSVFSISDQHSNGVSRRASYTEESGKETQADLNDKIAYIKNVLLGFLEHKEQREMLLPVVSTLLHLDSNDEKRLLISIR
ncbi:LAME_0H03444g1_1 [Lachancea meyersii CBS 8951]|uniref:LAME_0H03444g1_1 n=1 Tax=Lachancea meyersii CBS 8951 TaxID=1266667 RepID=A0A1G4KDN0_9SACH|nr:LAME_0H03444g1_1 [Lachancea meyersii CBS 8951]